MRRVEENLDKLPKWAKSRIERLERDVEHYKTMAYAAATTDKTNVVVYDFESEHGLPPNSNIRFYIRRNGNHYDYFDVTLLKKDYNGADGTRLLVSCGDGVLRVEPRASNCLYIGKEYV